MDPVRRTYTHNMLWTLRGLRKLELHMYDEGLNFDRSITAAGGIIKSVGAALSQLVQLQVLIFEHPITSPSTGLPLAHKSLVSLEALMKTIETYLDLRPELKSMLQAQLLEKQAIDGSMCDELKRLHGRLEASETEHGLGLSGGRWVVDACRSVVVASRSRLLCFSLWDNCVIFCMFMNFVYNVIVIGVKREESVSFVSLSYVVP